MSHHDHSHRSGHDAAHGSHGADHHHGVGHVVSPKILIATALALLALTGLTVYSSQIDFMQFDLREMNIVVALAIAVVKATLVCLFFMHLRWDRPFNSFILVGSLAFVALFIGFAMTDSSEYQHEIIKGNTPQIQQMLDARAAEDPKEAPEIAAKHAGERHGH